MTTILTTAAVTAAVTLVVVAVLRGLFGREKQIRHEIEPLYAVRDEQFARAVGSLLPPALLAGNRVTALHNGVRIFPDMLQAIRAARRTICFETFIYWSGRIGQEFADALSDRARAGVKVHVLIDWLGSKKIDRRYVRQLLDAGAEVERYHPVHWYAIWRVNERTHRKLLIVDGEVGFTGGVGIADEWDGDADRPDRWRDSHYRVEGPAVAQLQSAFMDNWTKTHNRVLHGEAYFPRLAPAGERLAQVFMSSPGQGAESMPLMYLLAFAAARASIRLASAYFAPDDLFLESLSAAARRGVRVRVLLPGRHIDTQIVRRAGRACFGRLLEAGVEIYEYLPCMLHNKLLVVDERWVSVGSTNCDNRSLRLNDEANLNVLDDAFAREQADVFDRDLASATRVTLEQWRQRPWKEKLAEHAARLLRPQL